MYERERGEREKEREMFQNYFFNKIFKILYLCFILL